MRALLSLLCFAAGGNWAIAWRPAVDLTRSRRYWNPTSSALQKTMWLFQNKGSSSNNGCLLSLSAKTFPAEEEHPMSKKLSTPPEDLRILLEPMIDYFESMVDPDSKRFFLFSHPQSSLSSFAAATNLKSHAFSPLRDMGSAWDACKALKIRKHYYSQAEATGILEPSSANKKCGLEEAVLQTTGHYCSSLVDGGDSMLYLSPKFLKEPPNIAHNALLLLALVGSKELNLLNNQNMDGLASGILSLQRPDGAFWTQFGSSAKNNDEIYRDIEFLPGQAMTALMEVHLRSAVSVKEGTLDRILPAVLCAFDFYRGYYQECLDQNKFNTNYSIWQIQAFSRLALGLRQLRQQQRQQLEPRFNDIEKYRVEVTNYCLELCQDILRSPAWKLLSRGKSFYPNLSTIEIACGLDALCQGYHVLLLPEDNAQGSIHDDFEMLEFSVRRHIDEALAFLKWSQDRLPPDDPTYGGLGHGGYCVGEQRLDVTGHAIGAVANLVLSSAQE